MSTADERIESLRQVLSQVSGQADARLYDERWTTLRLANNHLYQPHEERLRVVSLRVAREGGRIGVATTTDLSREGLAQLARSASAIASNAPPLKSFPGFPGHPDSPVPSTPFSESILRGEDHGKGEEIEAAIEHARTLSVPRVAGVYNEGACTLTVVNTSGREVSTRRSVAQASLLVEDLSHEPPVSGWAELAHWDPRKVDLGALAAQAISRTPREKVRPVEPGNYSVVFRPPAVGSLLGMLSMGGLGAYAVDEGWSFLCTPSKAHAVAHSLEISDDPLNPLGLPTSIDYEGTPHTPRPMFHGGAATGPAHDLLTGARSAVPSTGNALPPEPPLGREGPLPLHLRIAPGTASEEEMIKEMGSGLVVTRLHYVRFVNRQKTIITGMTRDGTYRVEGGRITHPVANLRMTDSILGMLSNVRLVGRDLSCINEDERGVLTPIVPALQVSGAHFSSATIF